MILDWDNIFSILLISWLMDHFVLKIRLANLFFFFFPPLVSISLLFIYVSIELLSLLTISAIQLFRKIKFLIFFNI